MPDVVITAFTVWARIRFGGEIMWHEADNFYACVWWINDACFVRLEKANFSWRGIGWEDDRWRKMDEVQLSHLLSVVRTATKKRRLSWVTHLLNDCRTIATSCPGHLQAICRPSCNHVEIVERSKRTMIYSSYSLWKLWPGQAPIFRALIGNLSISLFPISAVSSGLNKHNCYTLQMSNASTEYELISFSFELELQR